MPSFRYEALDASGRKTSGLMDGTSVAEIIKELDRAGFLPIKAAQAQTQTGRSLARPADAGAEVRGHHRDDPRHRHAPERAA